MGQSPVKWTQPAAPPYWQTATRTADLSRANSGGGFVPLADTSMVAALAVGTYNVRVVAQVTQAGVNADFRFSLQFSGTLTSLAGLRSITNVGSSSYGSLIGLPNAGANATPGAEPSMIVWEFRIVVTVAGNLQLFWNGDDAANNTTLLAGSRIEYRKLS